MLLVRLLTNVEAMNTAAALKVCSFEGPCGGLPSEQDSCIIIATSDYRRRAGEHVPKWVNGRQEASMAGGRAGGREGRREGVDRHLSCDSQLLLFNDQIYWCKKTLSVVGGRSAEDPVRRNLHHPITPSALYT